MRNGIIRGHDTLQWQEEYASSPPLTLSSVTNCTVLLVKHIFLLLQQADEKYLDMNNLP